MIRVLVSLFIEVEKTNNNKFTITEGQFGTLDKNYIIKDNIWIKTENYLRRPRYGYEGINTKSDIIIKWERDDIDDMFFW
jgi:hypothetical protein